MDVVQRLIDCSVDAGNIGEWINAGTEAVGAGSSLTAGAKTGDYDSIVTIGMQMVEQVKKARESM